MQDVNQSSLNLLFLIIILTWTLNPAKCNTIEFKGVKEVGPAKEETKEIDNYERALILREQKCLARLLEDYMIRFGKPLDMHELLSYFGLEFTQLLFKNKNSTFFNLLNFQRILRMERCHTYDANYRQRLQKFIRQLIELNKCKGSKKAKQVKKNEKEKKNENEPDGEFETEYSDKDEFMDDSGVIMDESDGEKNTGGEQAEQEEEECDPNNCPILGTGRYANQSKMSSRVDVQNQDDYQFWNGPSKFLTGAQSINEELHNFEDFIREAPRNTLNLNSVSSHFSKGLLGQMQAQNKTSPVERLKPTYFRNTETNVEKQKNEMTGTEKSATSDLDNNNTSNTIKKNKETGSKPYLDDPNMNGSDENNSSGNNTNDPKQIQHDNPMTYSPIDSSCLQENHKYKGNLENDDYNLFIAENIKQIVDKWFRLRHNSIHLDNVKSSLLALNQTFNATNPFSDFIETSPQFVNRRERSGLLNLENILTALETTDINSENSECGPNSHGCIKMAYNTTSLMSSMPNNGFFKKRNTKMNYGNKPNTTK